MSEFAIELDHVWKKFRRGELHDSLRDLIPAATRRLLDRRLSDEPRGSEFWALRDVSLAVGRGEVFGIIGPNGSGKSTILKLLSGILRPNRGSVRVNGRLSALIEVGAGFHPELSGRENIYLNGAILGMTKRDIDRSIDEIVDFSGLEDFLDTPVKRYSSGMYARLGFSVAAHVNPEILLVDEVLSVGDMTFQRKCIEKMLAFKKGGRTIVFISHNLDAVHTLCTRSALLVSGELKKTGQTGEVIRDYITAAQQPDPTADGPQIWDAEIRDERGVPVERLRPGQTVHLPFKLKAGLPYDECVLSFSIRRAADGLQICDYNIPLSDLDRIRTASDVREGMLVFKANMLRGSYKVELMVYHSRRARIVGGLQHGPMFSVEELDSYNGIAHLEPVLTWEQGVQTGTVRR